MAEPVREEAIDPRPLQPSSNARSARMAVARSISAGAPHEPCWELLRLDKCNPPFHPLGLLAIIILGLGVLLASRKHAVLPMIITACFIAPAQRIVVGSLDFDLMRIMVIFGMEPDAFRKVNSEAFNGRRLIGSSSAWKTMRYHCIHPSLGKPLRPYQPAWQRLRRPWDVLSLPGPHPRPRRLLESHLSFRGDQHSRSHSSSSSSTPVAGMVLPSWVVFRHHHGPGRQDAVPGSVCPPRSLAGCLLGLPCAVFHGSWRGGVLAISVCSPSRYSRQPIILMTASSTPIAALGFGIVGMCFLPLPNAHEGIPMVNLHRPDRTPGDHEGTGLAPDFPARHYRGSTGWHWFYLIDQAIRRVGEWWLIGTRSTGHWGMGLQDVTNQYILEGVWGGMRLHCSCLSACFGGLSSRGRIIQIGEGNRPRLR